MGYVTSAAQSALAPNDLYIATDVGGAYRFDRRWSRWVPLMERLDLDQSETLNTESIAVDPANASTVYVAANYGRQYVLQKNSTTFYDAVVSGEVLQSNDRGATWSPTGLRKFNVYMGSNDEGRGVSGERLAVDPLRPGQLYYGSRKDGLWRLVPGKGWAKVTGGLPDATSSASIYAGAEVGVTFVATALQTTPVKRSVVVAGIWGRGLYISYDGGDTFAAFGGDTNPARAAFSRDGQTFYGTFGDGAQKTGSVKRYTFADSKWTTITPTSTAQSFDSAGINPSFGGVSVDPNDNNVVVVAQNNNWRIFRSTDRGTTWTKVNFPKTGGLTYPKIANEPGYYPKAKPSNYFTPAGAWGNAALVIDGENPKRLWQSNGYGLIRAEDYTAADPAWSWIMTNLEELVTRNLRVPPTLYLPSGERAADLFTATADMVGFRHDKWTVPPSSNIVDFPWVAGGTSIDISFTKPQYVVLVGWDQANYKAPITAYSSDHGKTWAPFGSVKGTGWDYGGVNQHEITMTGGQIAMSSVDPKNMVWVSTGFQTPNFTTDGGNTWKPCRTAAGDPLPAGFQSYSEWWHGQTVVADKVNGKRFYYVESGIYQSKDGGATWTHGKMDFGGGGDQRQWTKTVNLTTHPAREGELFISFLNNENDPTNHQIYRSTDGGDTFAPIPGFEAAQLFALGGGVLKSKPFWYVLGKRAGDTVNGIYKSEDEGKTWIALVDTTNQQFVGVESMEGDLRYQNVLYLARNGRGFMRGDLVSPIIKYPADVANDKTGQQ